LSSSDDTLKIPIEIKTEDLDEIRELINEISKAEADLHTLKATPRKGKGTGDDSSRSAFTPNNDLVEDERGGIFNNRGGGALPSKGRDTKSATPHQRENEFAKLQEQVKEQGHLIGIGEQVQSGLGTATQAAGFASLLGSGGIGGAIKNVAGKAFLPIAIVTIITDLITKGLDAWFGDGGPGDRRFRRRIKEEIASASERTLKAEIAQSLKVIRMTSYAGFRGTAFSGNAEANRAGNPIYDSNMEGRSKGL